MVNHRRQHALDETQFGTAGSVQRFSSAWRRGEHPKLRDFVTPREANDVEHVAELIRVDMQERAQAGEEVCLDEYLDEWPALRQAPIEVVALILDEYTIRTDAGEVVDTAEYASRFPEHLDTLRLELGITVEAASDEVPRQSPDIIAGTRLGDFRIEQQIGSGGVSRVYRALQCSLNRVVALKVTDESSEKRDMACHEGRTMASLNHPHIVPVFAEQVVDQHRLLAMGLVDGPSLLRFLEVLATENRNSLSGGHCRMRVRELAEASATTARPVSHRQPATRQAESFLQFGCTVIRDLARALAEAHAHDILHCDVKPANVLFSADGRPMLTDFNVSVQGGHQPNGPVGGTLLYMAPEHFGLILRDSTEVVDGRADVYSLGLVMFQLLTGAWPFEEHDTSGDPLAAAAHLRAIRLSTEAKFQADWCLSPGLQSIIRKCLAPIPSRYQSAEELAEDLERHLEHRPLRHAHDPSVVERGAKWFRRNRAFAGGLVVCCLICAMVWTAANDTRPPLAGVSMSGDRREAHRLAHVGAELVDARKFEEAIPVLERARKLNPREANVNYHLGIARFRADQPFRAAEAFDRAIKSGLRTGLAYSLRGAARFASNDVRQAEADFEMAQRVATSDEMEAVMTNVREFRRRLNERSR